MKIGVIGYYGMGNTGDDRILHCLTSFFNDHEIFPFSLGTAREKIGAINSCDYVLIGGGGLLLRGINKWYDLIKMIDRPLGLVGIGVEAMNKDMTKTVNLLLNKSEFFLVRDQESGDLLSNHPKVMVGPDISFLSPYDLVDPTDKQIVGLNLRDWFPLNTEYGGPLWLLLNSLPKSSRSLKMIWPGKKWDEKKFVPLLGSYTKKILPMPFSFNGASSISDFYVLKRYFRYVPNFFDISWFKKIRYLVAMRFHAIAFSIQCGIPFVCISYQPKCERICRSIGMSHYCLDVFSEYDKIVEKLYDLDNNYEKIRRNLINHRQKLADEIKSVMNKILTFIEK